ncbi:hypothetical protein K505DRAFT_321236 [Melanomma pulvis-pyrius CBS 109.77]|uniref:Uncharacterized protein n=1 Tax=Melanomma pulvis-pyrius CBS 109.77 TaxID=1314802 RepID=A0A6A6XT02_9PLEO|nr:hypothetical protein K505DRAFT_321236 [Melanomma pulvis-pyrius CBS 109.77]
MATPQPPLTPDQRIALEQKARYEKFARNAAIGGVIICPIIALMPPRKLDLYTFSLGIGFYLSADHLATSYTGRGLVDNAMRARLNPIPDLPTEKARETQQKLREDALEKGNEAMRKGREDQGIWHRLWMGNEPDNWKEKRMAEERQAFEEGKTYTSIILDQIWEVWNWDKKKDEEEGKNAESKKP